MKTTISNPKDEWRKWRTLLLLVLAELLAMAVWFSATAVMPALTDLWQLSDGSRAWLTMSVQIGFVIGSMASCCRPQIDQTEMTRKPDFCRKSGYFACLKKLALDSIV